MLVKEAMTAEVVKIEKESSLDDATESMIEEDVGSVVVLDEGTPTGMVTEKDVLKAVYGKKTSLKEIKASEVVHHSPVTTTPNTTVMEAMDKMNEYGVKKLPVMDGLDLVGIITTTDISRKIREIRKEAADLSEEKTEDAGPR